MDHLFLSQTRLFRDISPEQIKEMLSCLNAYEKKYAKDETIFLAGDCIEKMGLVLSGSVNIEINDLWGNRSILARVETGQLFGETYACIPGEALMVDAIANENCEVLFIYTERLFSVCQNSCFHHRRLIQNLLQVLAQKNLVLSRRNLHTSPKTIRGRLLSYFSEQVKQAGSYQFDIPFNRQQLADYLGVDRSALSNELSKMRVDGILDFHKNRIRLKNK